MSAPVAVTARGWGWRHAGRRAWAIHDLDLRIEAGERVLLLGASGSGKSTLLAGMAGLLAEQDSGECQGSLTLDGVPAHEARGRVGLLLQDPQTQLVMSRAGDDVAFGPENHGVAHEQIWQLVDTALSQAGFPYGRNRLTEALSGGEKQRLALAGVLALAPGLLLLDEPTANLDPENARRLVSVIGELCAQTGMTLVVVEHRVQQWLDVVDRVVVLGDGVIADGVPSAIFHEQAQTLAGAGVWLPQAVPPVRRATQAPGTAVLNAHGVGLRYRGEPDFACHPVDLELRAGELTAIEGPSGSGKSSLAMMLAGLQRPTVGMVSAPGSNRALHRWRSRSLATHVGTVFQEPEHQFLRSSVRDELLVTPQVVGWSSVRAQDRADELLATLRLEHLAAANPFTLSGGQQRRLSVATALAAAPPILILDEPTFGQDSLTWNELVTLLADLRDEGCSIVAVSHDSDFVQAVADRRLTMTAGRL